MDLKRHICPPAALPAHVKPGRLQMFWWQNISKQASLIPALSILHGCRGCQTDLLTQMTRGCQSLLRLSAGSQASFWRSTVTLRSPTRPFGVSNICSLCLPRPLSSRLPSHALRSVSRETSPHLENALVHPCYGLEHPSSRFACPSLPTVLGLTPVPRCLLSLLRSFWSEWGCISFVIHLYFPVPKPTMSNLQFQPYQITCLFPENKNHVTIVFITLSSIVPSHFALQAVLGSLLRNQVFGMCESENVSSPVVSNSLQPYAV